MHMNLPNLLTWARIAAIPVFLAVLYLPSSLLALDQAERNAWATLVFVAAAVTDWLDGYLARRLGLTSSFGAFLDPVADKLMVCAALCALLADGRVGPVVGLVIIGREITISALREWMAELGARKGVAVNWLGKMKTIAQMVAIPFLIYAGPILGGLIDTRAWGDWLIIVAAVLTVASMVYYLQQALPHLRSSS